MKTICSFEREEKKSWIMQCWRCTVISNKVECVLVMELNDQKKKSVSELPDLCIGKLDVKYGTKTVLVKFLYQNCFISYFLSSYTVY